MALEMAIRGPARIASYSFDVVSDFDRQELVNTLDQVRRDVGTRRPDDGQGAAISQTRRRARRGGACCDASTSATDDDGQGAPISKTRRRARRIARRTDKARAARGFCGTAPLLDHQGTHRVFF